MPQKKKNAKKNAAKRAVNKKQQETKHPFLEQEAKATKNEPEQEKQEQQEEKPALPDALAPTLPPESTPQEQPPPIQYLQVPDQMDFPQNSSENIDAVQKMTGKGGRVTVTDGRVFEGVFACTDRKNNVILRNTEEFRSFKLTNHATGKTTEVKESHMIGLVTIPGSVITKIEAWEPQLEISS